MTQTTNIAMKALTTIPQGSRAKRLEKRRVSPEIMIWSDLHGDMQQLETAGGNSRLPLNTLSVDMFLGMPFNIASYALLTSLLAYTHGLVPKELTVMSGDTHIYLNHLEQVDTQLARTPADRPRLVFNCKSKNSILDYDYADFHIEGYVAQPSIKAPIAV